MRKEADSLFLYLTKKIAVVSNSKQKNSLFSEMLENICPIAVRKFGKQISMDEGIEALRLHKMGKEKLPQ